MWNIGWHFYHCARCHAYGIIANDHFHLSLLQDIDSFMHMLVKRYFGARCHFIKGHGNIIGLNKTDIKQVARHIEAWQFG